MLFWIAVLLMLTGAILSVLVPLARRPAAPQETDPQIALYREQLLQLDAEPDVADMREERAEIARRLIEADERSRRRSELGPNNWPGRIAAGLALLFLPAFSLSMYWSGGSPVLATAPASTSVAQSLENRPVEDLIAIAERQLQDHPNDVRGWTLLADVYARLSQPAKRAHALRQIIRLRGPSADLLADLGEAVVFQNDGAVTADALAGFERAIALDADHQKSAAYLAIALEQEGKFAAALARWKALSRSAQLSAERRTWVETRIATLENRMAKREAPSPDSEQVREAAALPSDERSAMIRGMVERLATRLEQDPDDFEGWLRLIRSHHVLGDREKVDAVWQRAEVLFGADRDKQRRLTALASEIGYDPTSTGRSDVRMTQ